MKCVKLELLSRGLAKRHSSWMYRGWMEDWGEFWLLDQVLGPIHVGDRDNQRTLENVFRASSVLLQSVDENRTDQAA